MDSLRKIKKEVRSLIEKGDIETLRKMAPENPRVVSAIIALTYDKDSLLTWKAIEAMGEVVKEITERSVEEGGNVIRRLLWSITEESGGIGWSALEMLAEVIRNAPEQYAQIVPLIIEYYDEAIFRPSVLYALCRIGSAHPELIYDHEKVKEILTEALSDPDPTVRGYALFAYRCLKGIVGPIEERLISDLRGDESEFTIYIDGQIRRIKIKDIALDTQDSKIETKN